MPERSVVVTGASTGIGRATVHELVNAGFHVFGTVRQEADADNLRQQFPETVTPLFMDLLDEHSVRAAGDVVKAAGPLFGLVNNAGAALPGPLETIPIEVFRRQIEINLTAQLLVTQVMLPALHRSADEIGDARIVMSRLHRRPTLWADAGWLRCRQAWFGRVEQFLACRTRTFQDQGLAD